MVIALRTGGKGRGVEHLEPVEVSDGVLVPAAYDRSSLVSPACRAAAGVVGYALLATDDLARLLEERGFRRMEFRQTLHDPPGAVRRVETPGHGQGGVIAVRAVKTD